MTRYYTAEAILQEDTESDEDIVAEGDANDSEDGDYLPGAGTASDTEDHVSEESEESEDVSTSDEEQLIILVAPCFHTVGSFSVSVISNHCILLMRIRRNSILCHRAFRPSVRHGVYFV